jgi:ethanolamine utilization protein EutA (predicted chaperonin)
MRDLSWALDHVELTTVGVDIGSSTSHLIFSRLWLERERQLLSSRFIVTRRATLSESPIRLTPYRADGLIDVERLAAFITSAYAAAGLTPGDIDTGAVILTGVALERANSRSIAELFARDGGKFVCASAGHILEAILAAHGSGAVERSRESGVRVLNVDIGGGTTKFALVEDGRVTGTLVIGVGARLIRFAADGTLEDIEKHGATLAGLAGVRLRRSRRLSQADRKRLAETMAREIVSRVRGNGEQTGTRALHLAGSLPARVSRVDAVTFSGGVSEFLYGREAHDYCDLGRELADAVRSEWPRLPPVAQPAQRIRATVIGAAQYTVQLSGNTVHISDPSLLPLRNVPVVSVTGDPPSPFNAGSIGAAITRQRAAQGWQEAAGPVGVAVTWQFPPRYAALRSLAEGLLSAGTADPGGRSPIVVALRGDMAASLGRILRHDLGVARPLVILDGLDLAPLDYLDVGELRQPSGVVPVVIKSLLFPGSVADEAASVDVE